MTIAANLRRKASRGQVAMVLAVLGDSHHKKDRNELAKLAHLTPQQVSNALHHLKNQKKAITDGNGYWWFTDDGVRMLTRFNQTPPPTPELPPDPEPEPEAPAEPEAVGEIDQAIDEVMSALSALSDAVRKHCISEAERAELETLRGMRDRMLEIITV